MKFLNLSDGQQDTQNGTMTYMRKKGNQHTTNTPMIIPRVLAARLSLDNEILCFMLVNRFVGTYFLALNLGMLSVPDTTAGVAHSLAIVDVGDASSVRVLLLCGGF
jgi:hypothetical protein